MRARTGDLVEAASGRHAVRCAFDDRSAPIARVRVSFLDQQPSLVARLSAVCAAVRAHERPSSFELLAVELELETPLGVARHGIFPGSPGPAIPQHYRPGTVLLRGDHAL